MISKFSDQDCVINYSYPNGRLIIMFIKSVFSLLARLKFHELINVQPYEILSPKFSENHSTLMIQTNANNKIIIQYGRKLV